MALNRRARRLRAGSSDCLGVRHGGSAALARPGHDLPLRQYLDSEESHELGAAFAERRA
jgi:naphthoate synthase